MNRTDRDALVRAALALVVTAFVLAGCQRKTQFFQGSDSSGVAVDSGSVQLRELQIQWEAGGGEDAARLGAQALLERVRGLAPGEWKSSADALLDSLGIGFESADGPCGLAVNFFARSDPGAGSWPWLFTCGEHGPSAQSIEGKNLRLLALTTRALVSSGPPPTSPAPGVAALFARRAGAGLQPVLMTWKRAKDGARWALDQTLGSDSLGGVGTGEFSARSDTLIELVTRTYRTPAFFAECATCPHLFKLHRFRWGAEDYARAAPDSTIPSPYATFVAFIQALVTNDVAAAEALTTDRELVERARELDWGRPKGAWRVAPAANESPNPIVFFRGDAEAYRVHFDQLGDHWRISTFEDAPRTVE